MDKDLLSGRRILLINDNPVQLEIFRRYLEKAECEVHAYLESAKALEFALTQPEIDGIVTDLYMPNIDGWKVCRLLRSEDFKHCNELPILVTSATFSGAEAESITQELGANAFVNVPIDKGDFLRVFSQVIGGERHIRKKRVLLVEDDIVQSRVLERAFDKQGFRVECAGNGVATLESLDKFKPSLVILDYQLPDTQGDELIEKILDKAPNTVVIVITATHRPEKSVEMLKKGAFSYLVKPFDPAYLCELCEIALREKSLLLVEDLLESRTQQALRNERNYRLLINHIPSGVFEVNWDGEIEFVSTQWEVLTRFNNEVVLGKKWIELLSDEYKDAGSHFWERISSIETTSEKQTWKWVLGDGEIGWFDITFTRRERDDYNLEPPVFIGVLEDVSEKVRLEQIKEREKIRAFHAHKMISLGQMSTGVAHEINNPLTIALNRSSKILKDWANLIAKPEDIKSYVEKINSSCERIMKVVSSLRTLSPNQETEKDTALDVTEVLRSTVKLYSEKLSEEKISLDLICPKTTMSTKGKVSDLSQVFVNLIDNAMYFSRKESPNKLLQIECHLRSHFVEILFSDNGVGIPFENQEKIFEPFFTTKPPTDGSGLGLTIAQSIIERMQGTLEICEEDSLTVFRIELPLAKN